MYNIKFLVDENVGHSVINFLSQTGYDLLIAKEEFTGRDNEFLVKKAIEKKRIIITNDKDFGFLVYRLHYPAPGVILFRFKEERPALKINALKYILQFPSDKIYNHFIVASDRKIRIRSMTI